MVFQYCFTLQIEGRFETLILAEEGIALKIPVGADYIESPGAVIYFHVSVPSDCRKCPVFSGGKFYSIKWTKDREGRLKIYDYVRDGIEDSR